MDNLSKTQIDRLGDRLKGGPASEADLTLLDEYRLSFRSAYDEVVKRLREMKLDSTGRPAKSTSAVVDKLRRKTIRLSQMQDISGCRIVLPDTMEQQRVLESLAVVFPAATVIDRRQNPSYGYRAVHIVARVSDLPVEIQVRTLLQHKWAELSEKLADLLDLTVKYGGGPPEVREILLDRSKGIAELEELEYNLLRIKLSDKNQTHKKDIEAIEERIASNKQKTAQLCEDLFTWLASRENK